MTDKKTVALIGTAPSKRDAPYKDDSVDIWTLSQGIDKIPRKTIVFEMHKPCIYNNYIEELKKIDVPLYMAYPCVEIPASKAYPLDEIRKRFCKLFHYNLYANSSIDYMIMLAILRKYQRIELWGVHMSMGEEYRHQRPSCEFWAGYAMGLGVEIFIPPESDILKTTYLYGYEDRESTYYRIFKRRANIRAMRDKLTEKLCNYQGGQDVMAWLGTTELVNMNDKKIVDKQIEIDKAVESFAIQRAAHNGAVEESEYIIQLFS